MLFLPSSKFISVNGRSQRTSRSKVWKKNGLLGRDDRRGLGHEMDSTEHDHISRGPRRSLRQAERVAHKIRNVLHLRHLVIVRQYDRVPLTLQPQNVRYQPLVRIGLE